MSRTTIFRSTEPGTALLAAGILSVLVAFATLASDSLGLHVVGWLCGGPLTTTLIAVERLKTTRWSAETGRVASRGIAVAGAALVLVGFVVSAIHASAIALDLS